MHLNEAIMRCRQDLECGGGGDTVELYPVHIAGRQAFPHVTAAPGPPTEPGQSAGLLGHS
jgi:hypothetical protein